MEMFPEDIGIFSRLPVKSVGRFRCVSKPMTCLLSQTHFIKTHLNQAKHFPKQEETIIIVSYCSYYLYSSQLRIAHQVFDEMSTFPTNLSVDDKRLLAIKIRNVACCDGLILVWDDANKLLLFNHTTKEVHELITPSYALDSSVNYFTNGLGYDSFTDDYKVVTVSYCNVDHGKKPNVNEVNYAEMFVDLYSVKNGTWERVENCTNCHALSNFYSGVFVHGYIHWRATWISDFSSVIVAFNLKEEKFHKIIFPSWIGSMRYESCHIVSLGGCLGMYLDIVVVLSYDLDPLEIWIIKEYGVIESWIKYEMCSGGSSDYRTRCLLGNHQVVLEKHDGLGQRGVDKLVLYDLNQKTCKDIVVGGITDEFFVGGTSMASLVSPYPSNIRDVKKELCRINLVPKEPSPSFLHNLISGMEFDTFVVCVCILVLGVFVAAIVQWRAV